MRTCAKVGKKKIGATTNMATQINALEEEL